MQALEETLALMDRKVALYRDMEHKLTQESTDV
jgi:hypothetical protein